MVQTTHHEIKFSFTENRAAWNFMREVDGECAGQPGFPSLDNDHAVRVIPFNVEQVNMIAKKHGGVCA